ncbi:hypothetical protein K1719_029927 [Acacia pycnantha]|nr:hypothetical protein K1719_029927 [Acacia pycnantha]
MAIHLYKTSTPSKRNNLIYGQHRCKGRNARGIITAGHRGGGHKRLYRKIDFRRNEKDIYGRIVTIEYDPNRNAYICLIHYGDGYKCPLIFHRRFLRTLKCKIKNPRYVEGSIAEAFLVEEATKFASYYYPPEVISRWRGVPRNDDGGVPSGQISIFNYPGRVVGKHRSSTLEGIDKKVAEWYILNNCEEAGPYLK